MAQHRSYSLQRVINDSRLLKVIIGEEVELVQEVANINAAKGIHLGERQNTWKSRYVSIKCKV